jgi:hypothetical protein
MKIKAILIVLMMSALIQVQAQKYITKNALIHFFSETPAEKIEANNNQVNCALDSKTGDFIFKVLMQSFQFERALMQEHFNENYVESHLYPNSTFIGKVGGIENIDLSKNGTHEVTVTGTLTMHGVSKAVTEKGTLEVIDGKIKAKSVFNIVIADYNIKVPSAVMGKIADKMEVRVDATLEKFTK